MQNVLFKQSISTDQILKDASVGLLNIQRGNKNLIDASSYAKSMGKSWTLFFLILAFTLLLFDFLKS